MTISKDIMNQHVYTSIIFNKLLGEKTSISKGVLRCLTSLVFWILPIIIHRYWEYPKLGSLPLHEAFSDYKIYL